MLTGLNLVLVTTLSVIMTLYLLRRRTRIVIARIMDRSNVV